MPVPYRLLFQVTALIVREYRRMRQRERGEAAPAAKPERRITHSGGHELSLAGRLVRLVLIAATLWLIWREVTRRRAALLETRAATRQWPPSPEAAPAQPSAAIAAPPIAPPEPPAPASTPDEPASATGDAHAELIGWCARCHARRPMQGVSVTTTTSGRRVARGTCPVCHAGITRFVAREDAA
ncbi:MAG: hypothetical protein HXY39_01165 [Chloroflexi bacterium]|nr:hypothetical protein [Chloroflexota bacterium]